MTVRFDDSLEITVAWIGEQRASLGAEVTVLRDLVGRLRLLLERDAAPGPAEVADLSRRLGPYGVEPSQLVLDPSLWDATAIARERVRLMPSDGGSPTVYLVDRTPSEHAWMAPPVARDVDKPRVSFFGLKGGVGRSTSLVALARSLAEEGRRVLVVDLDLESPGVSSLLLREEDLPRFGVTDWLVERRVHQADAALIRDMIVRSRIEPTGRGELWVAPALGAASMPPADDTDDPTLRLRDGSYVAKLARAYATNDESDLARRLEEMLRALEDHSACDVVLIDSRAGLHELSSAVLARLGGIALLFASTTTQTWTGYRLLLGAWRRDPDLVRDLRRRVQVVASMVPEMGRREYLEKVRQCAYGVFTDMLYESDGDTDDASYDLGHDDAPHAPWPVYWRRELQEWDPAAENDPLTPEQFGAAFGPFLTKARDALALPSIDEMQ